jgi:toxin ParE1/3/4
VRLVRFSSRARAQLRAAARYLLEQSGDERAGTRLVRSIEDRMTKFAGLPGTLGRPRPELGDGLRSLPHHGYVVIFRYGDGTIDVVQVIHARRDPRSVLGND